MSLPIGFGIPELYLKDALEFLHIYKWLFYIPNTHLLVGDTFKNFDKEWLPHLQNLTNQQLNDIPIGYINEKWPESLKFFLKKLNSLKPNTEINDNAVEKFELPKNWFDGVNGKKKHEILKFAPIIHEFCQGSDVIVDIGAGLGYLPQLLFEKYRHKIIGIEADEQKTETAIKRQKKFYSNSLENIKYIKHYVTEDSKENIDSFTRSFFTKTDIYDKNNIKISIISLHSCADLTVDILKLFFHMKNIKNVVIMPCCYHRMKKTSDNGSKFENFPLSNCLKEICKTVNGEELLNVPFLRLACQNTSSSWTKMTEDGHKKQATNLLRRNILQLFAEKEGLQLSRLKRKCKTPDESTSAYLKELKHNYAFHDPKSNQNIQISNNLIEKIKVSIEGNEHFLNLFEVFTAFQTGLQNICENLVLLDRVLFVKENGVDCCAIKVANDELSPRCYALVARKPVDC